MARKFRRARVLWLPVVGNQVANEAEEEHWVNGPSGVLQVAGDANIVFDQVPVTFDYSDPASQEQGVFNRSLQDLTSGNAYRLRRIVGKFHAGATPQSFSNDTQCNIELCAGFIVNRTDDSGNATTTFISGLDASPLSQDAAQDPWIWRRKWILSPLPRTYTSDSLSGVLAVNSGDPIYPQTTAGYGSVADGPHIDQKTARVIANQERLFFWVAARSTQDAAGIDVCNVAWHLDVRILASLRSNAGNRRNASR